ncbi:bis(5'-nucleosyl)-tetraphosphatase (symmetrical) YqeK [Sporosarcina siberiensis]|uniref:bis(5'-nucleosyl)-tetraphosphatase (symmetrical) n=1 Tax=Sporosarcina siberiensis TaxID=1365606 RepID=A0ABW4SDD3_9BACL
MNLIELKSEISKRMPLKRYEHVIRVMETAEKLAVKHTIPVDHAIQAALYHDIAKYMERDALRSILILEVDDQRLQSFHHELWHGPVGAIIARDEFNVTNIDVLNAIRYHTTGRAGMSKLEKLIYVSDMIEPGRDFPHVNELREIAEENLDKAMEACIHQSVQFLVSKKVPVFPDSIDCYNEHLALISEI